MDFQIHAGVVCDEEVDPVVKCYLFGWFASEGIVNLGRLTALGNQRAWSIGVIRQGQLKGVLNVVHNVAGFSEP